MNDTTSEPNDTGKRNFLRFALLGSVSAWIASVLYPVLAFLKPPEEAEVVVTSVNAGKISDFAKDSGTIVKFGSKPVILLTTAEGEFKAFSAVCTHLDCTVQYRSDLGVIWCACHNGKYDLNGRNIAGPPPRPLEEYKITIQGDEVVIHQS